MNALFAMHMLTIVASLSLGGIVFWTNPRRRTNQCFLGLSVLFFIWLIWLAVGFMSGQLGVVTASVRWSCAIAALMPVAFNALQLTIRYPDHPWSDLARRSLPWLLASGTIVVLCFTRFLLRDVVIPQVAVPRAAEPVYGPGIILYAVFYLISLAALVILFARAVRQSRGLVRVELQFLLLATCIGILVTVTLTVLLPIALESSRTVELGPLGAILFLGCVAYGIATRRIMEAGYVLRRLTAQALLVVYLVGLYGLVWKAVCLAMALVYPELGGVAHLFAALAVAFAMAPAHGLMQRVANRLLVNMPATDVAQTVTRVTMILQSLGTLDAILERFSKVVASSVGTDRVVITMKNDTVYSQVYPPRPATDGEADEAHRAGLDIPVMFSADDPLVQHLEQSPEPVVVDVVKRLVPSRRLGTVAQQLSGMRMAGAVAIRVKGELLGLMLVGPRLSGRIYGRPEQQALQGACDQLAVAVENAGLYTEIQNSKIYNDILLDNLVSGVIAANNDKTITACNREAQRITRLGASQLTGRPIEVLPGALMQAFRDTFSTGQGFRNRDLKVRYGLTEEIPIQLGSSVFHGHDGEALGVLVVFNDLTVVKHLERQVRRTAHLASLGTLSAGMAHEIKNPLVTLKTFAQLLPERYGDSDFRETFSALVEKEVNRIDLIVNQLLKFGRPARAKLVPTELGPLLMQCVELAQAPLHQKGIRVQTDFRTRADQVMGDVNLLQQAFVNFFLNAIDAMEPGGCLTIRLFSSSGQVMADEVWKDVLPRQYVSVSVQDTGKGISHGHLGKIFDPFFTTKATGTGLGLSVVHGILREHSAMIDVESVVGKGTTFHIVFPLIDGEDSVAVAGTEDGRGSGANKTAGH